MFKTLRNKLLEFGLNRIKSWLMIILVFLYISALLCTISFTFVYFVLAFVAILIILTFIGIYVEKEEENEFKNRVLGKYYKTAKYKHTFDDIFSIFIFIIVLVTFIAIPLDYYYSKFGNNKLSTETEKWAHFGSYVGGTVGTICAIVACFFTLFLFYQQKKQNELSKIEFRQKQFETVFFTLSEKLVNSVEQNMHQFYLLLKIIFTEMYEYPNGDRKIYEKYVDILKTYLSNDVLDKMINEDKIKYEYHKNDNSNLYYSIKNIIEEYSLFQYLKLDFSTNLDNGNSNIIAGLTYAEINKQKILSFKISAFNGNNEILPIRISIETNPDELKEYYEHLHTHPEKLARQALADNPNTPKEILKRLSQDENEKVRQVAINTINLLKSQNDENK